MCLIYEMCSEAIGTIFQRAVRKPVLQDSVQKWLLDKSLLKEMYKECKANLLSELLLKTTAAEHGSFANRAASQCKIFRKRSGLYFSDKERDKVMSWVSNSFPLSFFQNLIFKDALQIPKKLRCKEICVCIHICNSSKSILFLQYSLVFFTHRSPSF